MAGNKRVLFIVCKDNFMTRFLQSADMFETFKFVGFVMQATQNPSHAHLSPEEMLDRCRKQDDDRHAVVGVMIPNVGSSFLPNHRVYSDGLQWTMVSDLCEAYCAPLTEECTA